MEPSRPYAVTHSQGSSELGIEPVRPSMIGILVFLLTLFPPLYFLYRFGIQAVFKFFAADSFYYLAIADKSLGKPFFTYDGVFPTNGFHPLWEYYLEAGFGLLPPIQEYQLVFTFLSGAIFTSVGAALFSLSLYRLVHRPILVLVASVPGFYYLAFSIINGHFHSTWSYVNGMESSLSILFFGLLSYLLIVRNMLRTFSPYRLIVVSTVTTLIVLSRLDDIFLFVPILAYVAMASSHTDRKRNVALTVLIPVVSIGAYLLFNLSDSGMLFPVSGTAKMSNLFRPITWLESLRAFLGSFLPGSQLSGHWEGSTWRALQMIVPAILSFLWLAGQGYLSPHRFRSLFQDTLASGNPAILIFIAYVPIKAAYNFFGVELWNQGHWYYPLAIMTANMIVLLLLDSALVPRLPGKGDSDIKGENRYPILHYFVAILYVILYGMAFVNEKQRSSYGADFYNFWNNRAAISSQLEALGTKGGMIECDDGIISYALQKPVLSGTYLALDKEAYAYFKKGEILDLAYARGMRMIASVYYTKDLTDGAFATEETLRRVVQSLIWGQRTEDWNFKVLLRQDVPDFHYVFISFEPRPKTHATR